MILQLDFKGREQFFIYLNLKEIVGLFIIFQGLDLMLKFNLYLLKE